MLIYQPLQGWLDHLRSIFPIKALVHVGAGNGQRAKRYAEWDVPFALLIEAEEGLYKQLATIAQKQKRWSAHNELISDKECEQTFFLASNPNEHGVIPPENLTCLWRNLKSKEQRQISTTTIESVLNSHSTMPDAVNWCVVDCLPALPIIQGAGKFIESLDVIIARAIVKEESCSEIGATKKELDAFLETYGFHSIAWEEERQPSLGSHIYIRDWKDKYRINHAKLEAFAVEKVTLLEARDHHAKLAFERQVQLEQITNSYDEQTKHLQELQQKIDTLGRITDEAVTQAEKRRIQRDAATREKVTLLNSQRQIVNLAAERQVQLEQLTLSHDEQLKISQELRQQLDVFEKIKEGALKAQHEELTVKIATLAESREEQAKLVAVRQDEISVLKAQIQEGTEIRKNLELQITELEQRHQLMNVEILKAEGQIAHIKGLFVEFSGITE